MKVTFYGTRGSIPVSDPGFQEFGGNTTCIALQRPDISGIGIVDAGSGIRKLGKELLARDIELDRINIAFTHFHWDHVQGFPFFGPAYVAGQKINILALGKGRNITNLKDIFSFQMQEEYFPVALEKMGADFKFLLVDEEMLPDFYGTTITAVRLNHPGGSYGYRIELDGKILVVCTDVEHGDQLDPKVIELARDADLLIHEAQYTNEELKAYKGWGHSSYDQAIAVAELANVKLLVMTHHDPDHDDQFLRSQEKRCQDRFKDCLLAREGQDFYL